MIASDYVGFGYSDAPGVREFEYTFVCLAAHVGHGLFKNLGRKQFNAHTRAGLRRAGRLPDCFTTSGRHSSPMSFKTVMHTSRVLALHLIR